MGRRAPLVRWPALLCLALALACALTQVPLAPDEAFPHASYYHSTLPPTTYQTFLDCRLGTLLNILAGECGA